MEITLKKGKYTFVNNTFTMSERDVKFATSFKITNPKTGNSMLFNFQYSTGPEFDPNTRWVYISDTGVKLELKNDPITTQIARENYLKYKLR